MRHARSHPCRRRHILDRCRRPQRLADLHDMRPQRRQTRTRSLGASIRRSRHAHARGQPHRLNRQLRGKCCLDGSHRHRKRRICRLRQHHLPRMAHQRQRGNHDCKGRGRNILYRRPCRARHILLQRRARELWSHRICQRQRPRDIRQSCVNPLLLRI